MHKSQSLHKQAGFSMIEVLMALVVVGLVLTAVAGMITNSVKARADARYRQIANEIAQDVIEKCRYEQATRTWEDFVAGVGSECIGISSVISKIGIDYTVNTDFFPGTTPPIVPQLLIVTVDWNSGRKGGTLKELVEVEQVFTYRN